MKHGQTNGGTLIHYNSLSLSLGHGTLSMADGSYFKGSFVLGEIEGHGYRVFTNGSTYTGNYCLSVNTLF